MKKQKTFFIAAVCLVLAATLTTGLVFTGCKPQDVPDPPPASADEPETTQPTTTQPTTTQPTTKPTEPPLFTEAPDVLSIIPSVQTIPTDAQLIAKEAINRYLRYGLNLICCDYELVVADLSQYLTEEQKEEYCDQQYRITCCQTEQQVREHIDRCLSEDCRKNGYPDSTLFKDGDGNLYTTIIPTCYDGYRHVEVVSQTKSKIVARACSYDEDGCFRNTVFTLRANGDHYQITKVEEDEDYQCKITVVDEGPYYQVLKYGNSHYGYRFYDQNGELRSHSGTEFHCPTITPITEHIMELAINYGPGLVNRTYYDLKTGKTETYDSVIAIGYGKVAYLDGELDQRVLVICDMFDRHKDSTFEYLGFAPEPMPVTEAAFSDDGSLLTLTYCIGKETEATQTVSATLF